MRTLLQRYVVTLARSLGRRIEVELTKPGPCKRNTMETPREMDGRLRIASGVKGENHKMTVRKD